jgi:hypothetical protein
MSLRNDFYHLATSLSQSLDSKKAKYERAVVEAADAWDATRSRTCPVYIAAQKKLHDAEEAFQGAESAFNSYWIARDSETKLRLH